MIDPADDFDVYAKQVRERQVRERQMRESGVLPMSDEKTLDIHFSGPPEATPAPQPVECHPGVPPVTRITFHPGDRLIFHYSDHMALSERQIIGDAIVLWLQDDSASLALPDTVRITILGRDPSSDEPLRVSTQG